MPDDEILTIRDVAALLKVGEKTIYTMAQVGDLPGFKVRGQWRFRRFDIDAWIAAQVEHGQERPVDRGGDQ
jgi:excisionase family DNA binding protein